MKTKITLLIGAAALVTLSFTFVNGNESDKKRVEGRQTSTASSSPIGGIVLDEVEK